VVEPRLGRDTMACMAGKVLVIARVLLGAGLAVFTVLVPGCSSAPSVLAVSSVRELGLVPNPPGASGRDSGMSARFGGHSVWLCYA
jgi:hypothetical protein